MNAQRHPRFALKTLAAATVACYAPLAHANPSGGTVVAGSATMQQQGNNLVVTNTPGAIINWQSFSIGQNELTRFVQQGASSAVLNRVTGQDPSKILGQLQSNGKVFLINPNGIVFGQGAQVDVAGLVASTLNISDEDFRAGRMRFEGGQTGSVRNAANITTASGGFVYLIAPNVENNGVIVSPKGEILLAAGSSVELVDGVDTSLRVRIKAPAGEALNVGQLIAEQGRIGVFAAAIRQQGVVSANRAEIGEGGKIVFRASREATLAAGSRTEAKGGTVDIDGGRATRLDGAVDVSDAAGKGGRAQLLGDRVEVDGRVDASGRDGGGTILVGGDYQGGNAAVRNADYTRVGTNAWLNADAKEKGDGGKIVAWSDGDTSAAGILTARGGVLGGNGGFAEVSGKRNLDFHTVVDLSAERGQRGKLLLDPTDFVVDSSNVGAVFGASADVELTATQDVIFDASAGSASTYYNVSVTADRDIDIRAGATLTSSNGSVTLGATRDILVGGDVNAYSNLTLTAGRNVDIGADLSTSSNTALLQVAAGNDITQTGIVTGAGDVRLLANDVATCSTYGCVGALSLGANVTGDGLVELQGNKIDQTDGTISLSAGGEGTARVKAGALGFTQQEGATISAGGLEIESAGDVIVSEVSSSSETVSLQATLTSGSGKTLDVTAGGGTELFVSGTGIQWNGAVKLATSGASITQNTDIASSIVAQSLDATVNSGVSGHSISLTRSDNQIGTLSAQINCSVSSGCGTGYIEVSNAGALTVGGTGVNNAIGDVSLKITGGDLLLNDAPVTSNASGGTVTLVADNAKISGTGANAVVRADNIYLQADVDMGYAGTVGGIDVDTGEPIPLAVGKRAGGSAVNLYLGKDNGEGDPSTGDIAITSADDLSLMQLAQIANSSLYLSSDLGLSVSAVGSIDTGTANLDLHARGGYLGLGSNSLSGYDVSVTSDSGLTGYNNSFTASHNLNMSSSSLTFSGTGTVSAGNRAEFETDSLFIMGGTTITAPTVSISTRSAGVGIDLGGSTNGMLALDSSKLNAINGGGGSGQTLTLHGSTVQVSSDISRGGDLTLVGDEGIVVNGGVSAANLALSAAAGGAAIGGGTALGGAIESDGTSVLSASGSLTLDSLNGIGTSETVLNISSPVVNVNTTADGLGAVYLSTDAISSHSINTVNSNISLVSTGSASLTLNGVAAGTGDVDIYSDNAIQQVDATVISGDSVQLTAQGEIGTSGQRLEVTAASAFGAHSQVNGGVYVKQSGTATDISLSTNNGNIDAVLAGDVVDPTLMLTNSGSNLTLDVAGKLVLNSGMTLNASTVTLTTGGDLVQDATLGASNGAVLDVGGKLVGAGSLSVTGNADVDAQEIGTGTSARFKISTSGTLTANVLGSDKDMFLETGGGSATLTSQGGTIDLLASGSTDLGGGVTSNGGDILVTTTGVGSNASVSLIAGSGDITVNVSGDLASNSSTSGDNVSLTAGGTISGLANATTLTLSAGQGVGTSSTGFESWADSVDATATGAGAGVYLNTNRAGQYKASANDGTIKLTGGMFDFTLDDIDAGAGAVDIQVGGSLIGLAGKVVKGDTVSLQVMGAIGSAGQAVGTDAATSLLASTSGNSAIYVTEISGVTNATFSTSNGDVHFGIGGTGDTVLDASVGAGGSLFVDATGSVSLGGSGTLYANSIDLSADGGLAIGQGLSAADVTLTASAGGITGSGLIGANSVTLSAASIGTDASNRVNTQTGVLNATATADGGVLYVGNTASGGTATLTSNNGAIDFSGGGTTIAATSSGGAITLQSTGALTLNGVDAGSGNVDASADVLIAGAAATAVKGDTIALSAVNGVGTSQAIVVDATTSLSATNTGIANIWLSDADGVGSLAIDLTGNAAAYLSIGSDTTATLVLHDTATVDLDVIGALTLGGNVSGNTIDLSSSGNLDFGGRSMSAANLIKLTSNSGAITGTALLSAPAVTLSGASIGGSAARVLTATSALTATATGSGGGLYVGNSGGSSHLISNGGTIDFLATGSATVDASSAGGAITLASSNGGDLSLDGIQAGAGDITVNSDGDLALTDTVGGDEVSLAAVGSIDGSGVASQISGSKITLGGEGIGAGGSLLYLSAGEVEATATGTGEIHLHSAGGTHTLTSAGGGIELALAGAASIGGNSNGGSIDINSLGGDMTLAGLSAGTGALTVYSGGGLVLSGPVGGGEVDLGAEDDISGSGVVSGSDSVALSGTNLGTSGSALIVDTASLTAGGSGGIYLHNNSGGSASLSGSVGTLAYSADGASSVGISNATGSVSLSTSVGNLGISLSGSVNDLAADSAGNLTIGSALQAGNTLDLKAAGSITGGNQLSAGTVVLEGTSLGNSGTWLSIDSNDLSATATGAGGGIYLDTTGGTAGLASNGGPINYYASGIASVSASSQGGDISLAGGANLGTGALDAGNGSVSVETDGDLSVSSTVSAGAIDLQADGQVAFAGALDSGSGLLKIVAGGKIDGTGSLTGGSVQLTAGSGIGAGGALAVDTAALAATAQGSGEVVTINTQGGMADLTSNGGAITLTSNGMATVTAASAGGAIDLNTVGSNALTLNGVNAGSGALTADSGGALTVAAALQAGQASLTAVGDIDGAGLITASTLELDAAQIGAIGSPLQTSAATLTANGQAIYLSNAEAGGTSTLASNGGAIGFSASNGGQVAATSQGGAITLSGGALTLNGVNAGSGDINVTAASLEAIAATQLTGNNVTLASSGAIGASQAIDIDAASSLSASVSGTGDIKLNEINGVAALSLDLANGTATVDVGGATTAQLNLHASGSAYLDVDGALTLGGAAISGQDVYLESAGDLNFGSTAITASSMLELESSGGMLSGSGILTAPDIALIGLSIGSSGNRIATDTALLTATATGTGGGLYIGNSGGTNHLGSNAGTIDFLASGAVGAATVDAASGNGAIIVKSAADDLIVTSLNAGSGALTLDSAANLTVSGAAQAGQTSLTAAQDVTVGALVDAGSANLTVQADRILGSGGFKGAVVTLTSVQGIGSGGQAIAVDASTLDASASSAGGGLYLAGQGGTVHLASNNGAIDYVAQGSTTLDASSNGGAIALKTLGGDLTTTDVQSGLGAFTIDAAGNVTLGDSQSNSVDVQADGHIAFGGAVASDTTLVLNAGGKIYSNGGSLAGDTVDLTSVLGTGYFGPLAITANTLNAAATGAGAVVNVATQGGTATLTSNGGAITLESNGTASVTASSAGGAIDLKTLTGSTLTLAGVNAGSGTATANAGGDLVVSGAVQASQADLTAANDLGGAGLITAGTVNLAGQQIGASGNRLQLAAGTLNANGGALYLANSQAGSVDTLTSAGGAIDFSSAGAAQVAATSAGGAIALQSAGQLTLNGVDAGSGDVTVGAAGIEGVASTRVVGNNVNLTSTLGIGAGQAIEIDAATLLSATSSGTGDIKLNEINGVATLALDLADGTATVGVDGDTTAQLALHDTANAYLDVGGALTLSGAAVSGHDVYLESAGNLDFGSTAITAGGMLELESNGGTITGSGLLTAPDIALHAVSIGSSGGRVLTDTALLNASVTGGDLYVGNSGGTSHLSSNGGAIDFLASGAAGAAAVDATSANGAITLVSAADDLTTGSLQAGSGVLTVESAANLTLTAAAQAGEIHLEAGQTVSSSALIDAGSGLLGVQAGSIAAGGSYKGGTVGLGATGAAGIGSAGQAVDVQAGVLAAATTDSGAGIHLQGSAGTASFSSNNGAIAFASSGATSITSAASNGGTITLQTGSGDLAVADVQAGNGTVTLDAAGALQLAGAVGGGAVVLQAGGDIGGSGVVSGSSIELSGANLGSAGNALELSTGNLVADGSGSVHLHNASGGSASLSNSGGVIDYLADGASTVGVDSAGGTVGIKISSGDLGLSLASAVAGLTADSAANLNLSGAIQATTLDLTAAGNLSGNGLATADNAVLQAASIGSSGNRLQLAATNLDASATGAGGGIYLATTGGTAVLASSGGDIDLLTSGASTISSAGSLGGDIILKTSAGTLTTGSLQAGAGSVALDAAGSLALNDVVAGGAIDLKAGSQVNFVGAVDSGGGLLKIAAGDKIDGSGSLEGGSVELIAGSGIGAGGALAVDTADLTATAQGSGEVLKINTQGGTADLSSNGGLITLVSTGAATVTAASNGGAIDLKTQGSNALTLNGVNAGSGKLTALSGGALTVAAALQGGQTELAAQGNLGGSGLISATTLNLSSQQSIGGSGNRLLTDAATLTAVGQSVYLDNAAAGGATSLVSSGGIIDFTSAHDAKVNASSVVGGSIMLQSGGVLTLNGIDAGSNGSVSVTAAGIETVDAMLVVKGGSVSLNSSNGIGLSRAVLVDARDSLSASVSGSGDIHLEESSGVGTLALDLANGTAFVDVGGATSAQLNLHGTGSAYLDVDGALTLTGAAISGQDVYLESAGDLDFGSTAITAGSMLELESSGGALTGSGLLSAPDIALIGLSIGSSGSRIQTGTALLTATATGTGGGLYVGNSGGTNHLSSAGGAIDFLAGGAATVDAVSGNGAILVKTSAGDLTTGNLNAGSGALTLDSAGQLTLASATQAEGIALKSAGDLVANGAIEAGDGALTADSQAKLMLNQAVHGNGIALTSVGDLSAAALDAGSGTLTVDSQAGLTLNQLAQGNGITLTSAGDLSAAALDAGSGVLAAASQAGLTVSQLAQGNGITLTSVGDLSAAALDAGSGALTADSQAKLTLSQQAQGEGIALTSVGDLSAAALDAGGAALTVDSQAKLTLSQLAQGNGITLTSDGDLSAAALDAGGAALTVDSQAKLTLGQLAQGNGITLTSAGDLSAAALDAGSGALTADSAAKLTLTGAVQAGQVELTAAGDLTANAQLDAGSGTLAATGERILGSGGFKGAAVTLAAVQGIGSSGQAIAVDAASLDASSSGAGGALYLASQGGTAHLASNGGAISYVSQGSTTVDASSNGGAIALQTLGGDLTTTDVQSGLGAFTIDAAGNVTLGDSQSNSVDVQADGHIAFGGAVASDTTLVLNAGGKIYSNGGSLAGDTVDLTSVLGTGYFGPLAITANTLNAAATGAGAVVNVATQGGTATLTSNGGAITLEANGAADVTASSAGGAIDLKTLGTNTLTLAGVNAGSGTATANAGGDLVVSGAVQASQADLTAAAKLSGLGLTTADTVNLAGQQIGSSGGRVKVAAATLTAAVNGVGGLYVGNSGGQNHLSSAGGAIDFLSTGSATVDAASGNGAITLQSAGVLTLDGIDAGSGNVTIGGDSLEGASGKLVKGSQVSLAAATGIGAAQAIEVDAGTLLSASNSGTGDIKLSEVGGVGTLALDLADGTATVGVGGATTAQLNLHGSGNAYLDVAGPLTLAGGAVSGHDVYLDSDGDLNFGSTPISASGMLELESAGALIGSGLLSAPDIALNGASIGSGGGRIQVDTALLNANATGAGGGLYVGNVGGKNYLSSNGGAIDFTATSSSWANAVSNGGAITLATLAGDFGSCNLQAGSGTLTVESAGSLTLEGAAQGSEIHLTVATDLTNNAQVDAGSGTLAVQSARILAGAGSFKGGTVGLGATGGVGDADHAVSVAAGVLYAAASDSGAGLNLQGEAGTATFSSNGGAIRFQAASATTIAGATSNGGAITLRTAAGDLTVASALAGAGALTLDAAGKLTVADAAGGSASLKAGSDIVYLGDLDVGSGLLSLHAGDRIVGVGSLAGGIVDLSAGAGIGETGTLQIDAGQLTATATGAGSVVNVATQGGSATLHSNGGAITLVSNGAASVAADSMGGAISLSTQGNGNALTVNGVDAGAGLAMLASAGDLALAGPVLAGQASLQAAGDIAGDGLVTAGSVQLSGLQIGGGSDARLHVSSASLVASGSALYLDNAAAGSDTLVSDGGAIDLVAAGGSLVAAHSDGGAISLQSAGALQLASIDAGSGDVRVSAAGISGLAGQDQDQLTAQAEPATVKGGEVVLASSKGIGGSAALTVEADRLHASNSDTSGGSDIRLHALKDLESLVLDAAGGTIYATVDGSAAAQANLHGVASLYLDARDSLTLTGNAISGRDVYVEGGGDLRFATDVAASSMLELESTGGAVSGSGLLSGADIALEGESIGSAAERIRVDTALLTAEAGSGSLYVGNTGGVNHLSSAGGAIDFLAGGTATVDAASQGGAITLRSTAGDLVTTGIAAGSGQLAVDSAGKLQLGGSTLGGGITLNAAGDLVNGGTVSAGDGSLLVHADRILAGGSYQAGSATLVAESAFSESGQAIDVDAASVNAAVNGLGASLHLKTHGGTANLTSNGGLIDFNSAATATVSASSRGGDIALRTEAGDLNLLAVSTSLQQPGQGAVSALVAGGGNITLKAAGTLNSSSAIVSQGELKAEAKQFGTLALLGGRTVTLLSEQAIGTADSLLAVDAVDSLSAATSGAGAGIHLSDANGVGIANLTTADGEIEFATAGTVEVMAKSGGSDRLVRLSTSGGDLVVKSLAASGTAELEAADGTLRGAGSALTAKAFDVAAGRVELNRDLKASGAIRIDSASSIDGLGGTLEGADVHLSAAGDIGGGQAVQVKAASLEAESTAAAGTLDIDGTVASATLRSAGGSIAFAGQGDSVLTVDAGSGAVDVSSTGALGGSFRGGAVKLVAAGAIGSAAARTALAAAQADLQAGGAVYADGSAALSQLKLASGAEADFNGAGSYSATVDAPTSAVLLRGAADINLAGVKASTATVAAGGAIRGSGSGRHLLASIATLTAGGDIAGLDSEVSKLTLASGGAIDVVNRRALELAGATAVGNLTVESFGGLATTGLVKAGGAVTLITHSPMTIGSAGIQAGQGIQLTSNASSSGNDSIVIDGDLTAVGDCKVQSGGSIRQNGDIVTQGGSIALDAAGGDLVMASGASSSSGGGAIRYASLGGMMLSLLDAGTGAVSLKSTQGSIGSVSTGGLNIRGGSLEASAGGGILLRASVPADKLTLNSGSGIISVLDPSGAPYVGSTTGVLVDQSQSNTIKGVNAVTEITSTAQQKSSIDEQAARATQAGQAQQQGQENDKRKKAKKC